jgi:hypothetical protein
LRINLDAKSASSFRPTLALKIQRDFLTVSDKDPKRSLGAFQNPSTSSIYSVVIEWVSYDKEYLDGRINHLRRIDDLTRMVHSASDRHTDLHTIDCLGYTDDFASSGYGSLYRAPDSSFSTLNYLITNKDYRTRDLGDRLKLAHTLAAALWSLHSLDWLHKGLSSSNILFFPSAVAASATRATATAATVADVSSPYLLGFDCSRPDHLVEMSVATQNPSSMDLHRHPDSLDGIDRNHIARAMTYSV